jgi:hypothetical protein
MNDQLSTLLLGMALTILGVLIIIKTWSVEWHELIRAIIFHPGRKPGAFLKWVGFAFTAGGIIAILAGLGIV